MTATTHHVNDLQRQGRTVLEEARAGESHLRDVDGTSLELLPEERVKALWSLFRYAAKLLAIERGCATLVAPGRPDPVARPGETADELGGWLWLAVLDDGDRQEFVRELRDEIIAAARAESLDESLTRVEAIVDEWRITAQALADPVRRAILLGRPRPEEFVEVGRPE